MRDLTLCVCKAEIHAVCKQAYSVSVLLTFHGCERVKGRSRRMSALWGSDHENSMEESAGKCWGASLRPIQPQPSLPPAYPGPNLQIILLSPHPVPGAGRENHTFCNDLGRNEPNSQEIPLNSFDERPCLNPSNGWDS